MNSLKQTQTFKYWMQSLKDKKGKVAIARRIERAILGNFGDHKFLRDGVYEMRLSIGAGYRIYYAKEADVVYLLLCGGDKSTQTKDIELAIKIWKEVKNG